LRFSSSVTTPATDARLAATRWWIALLPGSLTIFSKDEPVVADPVEVARVGSE
jgi:hypothetical protein